MSTQQASQYADHAEITIIGHTNTVPIVNQLRGTALQIISASNHAVSGSAVNLIFGNYKSFSGAGGLQSKITGELDISGIQVGNPPTTTVNNTLGRRLGDCSTSSQTLTVMAGGTAYTVTFNQNYTSMDNATIISAINSVLGDSAVSQEYVYNQYQSEITNWYGEYLNNTSAGIAAGATAYSTDGVSIQVSGTTQIGIAAEDINPGAYGRVRLKG